MKINIFSIYFLLLLLLSCSNDISNDYFIDTNEMVDIRTIKSTSEILTRNEKETEKYRNQIVKAGLFDLIETAFPNSRAEIIALDSSINVKKMNGHYIVGGDMLLTEEQIKEFYKEIESDYTVNIDIGISKILTRSVALFRPPTQYLWPNNTIYYTFSPSITNRTRTAILEAIQHWQSKSIIQFVSRTNQKDYVEFFNGDGCYSNVGRIGGKQQISIDADWGTRGNAIHEIGHTVGLYHEQCKANRDNFINIHAANIDTDSYDNYRRITNNYVQSDIFDYQSVMIYSSRNADAINSNLPVMTRKDGSEWIAQRNGLSDYDSVMVYVSYVIIPSMLPFY